MDKILTRARRRFHRLESEHDSKVKLDTAMLPADYLQQMHLHHGASHSMQYCHGGADADWVLHVYEQWADAGFLLDMALADQWQVVSAYYVHAVLNYRNDYATASLLSGGGRRAVVATNCRGAHARSGAPSRRRKYEYVQSRRGCPPPSPNVKFHTNACVY